MMDEYREVESKQSREEMNIRRIRYGFHRVVTEPVVYPKCKCGALPVINAFGELLCDKCFNNPK